MGNGDDKAHIVYDKNRRVMPFSIDDYLIPKIVFFDAEL